MRASDMPNPAVTVVIPYFNGAAYLAGALAQVRAQTFRDVEIIVVDDGSDPCQAEDARHICEAQGVRLLGQPNRGPGAARNLGVSQAAGAFIAFLDVDDLWLPQKLAAQMRAVEADPSLDMVLHDTVTREENGTVRSVNRYSKHSAKALCERTLRGDVNSFTSALLVRRDWFTTIGGFEERLRFREDHLLLIRGLTEGRFAVLPDSLSERRLHASSMSSHARHTDPSVHLDRSEAFLREVGTLYPAMPLSSYRARAFQRVARHNIVLGRRNEALRPLLRSFAIRPLDPTAIWLLAAIVLSVVVPGRFDHWHPGLASVRKTRLQA